MYNTLTGLRNILYYVQSHAPNGCLLSLDQAKAFHHVAHPYLFHVLSVYDFPRTLTGFIQRLYNNHPSSILLLRQSSRTLPVRHGVRQACPLSPALFTLAIDALLWSVDTNNRIQDLPLSGCDNWKVSAYAGDVTVLVRDKESVLETFCTYYRYAAVPGGLLNLNKTQVMALGVLFFFFFRSPLPIQQCDSIKILGVTFDPNGPIIQNWTSVLDDIAALRLLSP